MKRKLAAIGAAVGLAVGVGVGILPSAFAATTISAGYSNGNGTNFPYQPGEVVGGVFWVQNNASSDSNYAATHLTIEGCNAFLKVKGPDPANLEPGERTLIYCGLTRDTPGVAGASLMFGNGTKYISEVMTFEFAGPETTADQSIALKPNLAPGMDGRNFVPMDGGHTPKVILTHEVEQTIVTANTATALIAVTSDVASDLSIAQASVTGCTPVSVKTKTDPGFDIGTWSCTFPLTSEAQQTGKLAYAITFNGTAVNSGAFSVQMPGTLTVPVTETSTPEPSSTPPAPTSDPTDTGTPTPDPTGTPTTDPTSEPTVTVTPTTEPTSEPTATITPTTEPTSEPTVTVTPTTEPTSEPTATVTPTTEPTSEPTVTVTPTASPSATSTPTSSVTPTSEPTGEPSNPVDSPVAMMVTGPQKVRMGEPFTVTVVVANATNKAIENVVVTIPGCDAKLTEGSTTLDVGGRAVWQCDVIASTKVTLNITPTVNIDGVEQSNLKTLTVEVMDAPEGEPDVPVTTPPATKPGLPTTGV